jgi:Mrp family chromosome partitioning ATPase
MDESLMRVRSAAVSQRRGITEDRPGAVGLPAITPPTLNERLAGRRRWVLLGSIVGAVLLGALGWWVGRVEYRAAGYVQLAPVGANSAVESESVEDVDSAVDPPEAVARPTAMSFVAVAAREAALLRQLGGGYVTVQHDPQSPSQILLSSIDTEAEAAVDAVQSTLAAYKAKTLLHDDAASQARHLQARRSVLAAEQALAEATAERRSIVQATAGDAAQTLEERWTAASEQARDATLQRQRIERQRDRLRALPVPSVEQLEWLDPQMTQITTRIEAIEDSFQQPDGKSLKQWKQKVDRYRQAVKALNQRREAVRLLPTEQDDAVQIVELPLLDQQVQAAADQAELSQEAVTALATARKRWLAAEAAVSEAGLELSEARVALAQSPAVAAAELVASGLEELPGRPAGPSAIARDDRPWTALTGAGLGGLLGLIFTTTILLRDRRVRATASGAVLGAPTQLLAAVPVLNENVPEDAAGSAPIQRLRSMLEPRINQGDHAFALLGVGPGSGATSITVGIAASLALGGFKTLLIDFAWLWQSSDRDAPGDQEATRRGLGVDGVLAQLGYLEEEDREELTLGEGERVGFGALLNGTKLSKAAVETRVGNLSVLSAMGAGSKLRASFAGRISSRWIARLLEVTASNGYDVVLIDAGHAQAGVEAMLSCACADAAMVVVSNDEPQADYTAAVARLKLVDAQLLGTVLNRAGAKRRVDATTKAGRGVGQSVGSGIFAAAVEAGSGRAHVKPMPMPGEDPSDRASDEDDDTPTRPPQPTPTRTPPRRRQVLEVVSEADEQRPAAVEDRTFPTPKLPNPQAPATPAVTILDDVTDRFISQTIRTARQEDKPRATQDASPDSADNSNETDASDSSDQAKASPAKAEPPAMS